jgi:hypothetical protein
MNEPPSARAQVEEHLRKALDPHPWVLHAVETGTPPTRAELERIGLDGITSALLGAVGALIGIVDKLAAEIDRQNASR